MLEPALRLRTVGRAREGVTAAFPASIEAIDDAWLRSVLNASGVRLAAIEPVGHGTSSEVARLVLAYDGDPGALPSSLIAKAPRRMPEGRPDAAILGYAREVEAYRRFANPPCRIPRCHFAARNEDGGFLLLLEDLRTGWRAGDQIAGCGLPEAEAVVAELAALHATHWNSPETDALDWPRDRNAFAPSAAKLYADGAALMRERYPDQLGTEDIALIEAVAPLIGPWNSRRPEPRTIIHADPRVDNIIFEDRPDGVRACLIDLQSLAFWDPAFDLAYFLGGSLEPALRRSCERRLVAKHAAVMRAADPGYDTDLAWLRYRQHAMAGLMSTVAAASVVGFSPHVDTLLVTLARRNCAAVRDLDGIAAAQEWIAGR